MSALIPRHMNLIGFLVVLLYVVTVVGGINCEDQSEDGVCVPDPAADHNTADRECPPFEVKYESIEHYLNPAIFGNAEKLDIIAKSLQNGELVVIRNAFLPEYAEAMHCELDKTTDWKLQTSYNDDGFHFSHHNIYDRQDFTKLMNDSYAMIEHPDSKSWMGKLSNRDCSGDSAGSGGSPSYYMPGDHSLPHTDHIYQRTVAYVWHLSKNWRPEWGGALYWIPEHAHHAFAHASFNTLSLFSVHSDTPHFVSTVSPHATEKRLAFNGWWTSSWYPSADDDLEEMLSTPERRWDLTGTQIDMLRDLAYNDDNDDDPLDEERRQGLLKLMEYVDSELWPEYSEMMFEVDY